MSEEFPLYPALSEGGEEQAQKIMDRFKVQMLKIADECLGDLYTDVAAHIESDQWANYRNDLMAGLQNYDNRSHNYYNFKEIRQAILKEHRDAIIKDLNQDMVDEIESLKHTIELMIKYD